MEQNEVILDLNRRLGALEHMTSAMLAIYGHIDAVEKVAQELAATTLRAPGMEESRKRFDTIMTENFNAARHKEAAGE